jgi:hypothetical protein
MTRKQAVRQYDRIIRQCFRDMEGGLAFGMDWQTLRTTFPDRYIDLIRLRQIVRTLT